MKRGVSDLVGSWGVWRDPFLDLAHWILGRRRGFDTGAVVGINARTENGLQNHTSSTKGRNPECKDCTVRDLQLFHRTGYSQQPSDQHRTVNSWTGPGRGQPGLLQTPGDSCMEASGRVAWIVPFTVSAKQSPSPTSCLCATKGYGGHLALNVFSTETVKHSRVLALQKMPSLPMGKEKTQGRFFLGNSHHVVKDGKITKLGWSHIYLLLLIAINLWYFWSDWTWFQE